jgi:hypothetical protein
MLSRLPRPRFGSGVVVGAAVVGLVWLGASGILDRSGSINVDYGQIRSIRLQSVPEGPPGPLFVPRPHRPDELPLELVRDFVPAPLPAPLHQPGGCGNSGDLIIVLKGSGRTITYGPCRWPWQISELWGAMIESGEAVACASEKDTRSHVCHGLAEAKRRPFRTAF